MYRTPLAALTLILLPGLVFAEEMSFGGIELGRTTCAAAREILETAEAILETDESAITSGSIYRLQGRAMGLEFVNSGAVICDSAGDQVEAIELIIDKNAANTVADLIARKHQMRSRNLPLIGDGHASFISASGQSATRIDYVHLSFEATVVMSTASFDVLFDGWQASQRNQASRALEDAF